MAPSDAELVAAARDGDRAAFARLLARHRAGLLAACGRLLRDGGLAEDAAQEAAVTAYLQLERLRDPARFGAWLVGIGLNIGRRWLRARMRERRLCPGEAQGEAFGVPAPGPDEAAEARDLAARVHRAVAALPPGQRRAVVGYYLLGLGQREVAALLGTSTGAVKTRLHKARDTLADTLAADWQTGDRHAGDRPAPDTRKDEAMTDTDPGAGTQPVAMRVSDVCRLEGDEVRHVAILEEPGGGRTLPIWIGEPEGTALAAALEETDLPRPMTHWLAAGLLDAGGVEVRGVRVTRLAEGTFYGTVTIAGARGPAEVDARPSDALTLAVLTGAPVTVDADVLEIVEAQMRERGMPPAEQVRAEAQQHATEIVASALARWEQMVAGLREEHSSG